MEDCHYPREDNLGKNCHFWVVGSSALLGCCYPKMEMHGRQSCEGMIDDVCLFLKEGRGAPSLSEAQAVELKTRIPDFDDKSYIPPGSTR